MTQALAEEIPGAEASRLEIDRGGPSYSVDTAEEVLAAGRRPPRELFLVVGADLVPELGTWHRPEDLQRLVTLAVVSRPTDAAPGGPAGLAGRVGRRTAGRCLELGGPRPAGGGPAGRRAGPRGGDPLHCAAAVCTLCQMSAMPAGSTELSDSPRVGARPAPGPAPGRPPGAS